MKHHRYGVVESAVGLVIEDNPASIIGVTHGLWSPFDGIQGSGYQLSPQAEKLIVQGRPVAQESEIDEIPVSLKFGQFTPDIDALIANICAWYTAEGGVTLAVTPDFGNIQFGLKCRTDKVGINGMETILFYPKIQLSGMNRNGEQRSFAPNEYTTSAFFPDAQYPVYKDGVKIYRSVPVFEYLQPKGAPLYTRVSTAPTVVSVNGDSDGGVTINSLTPSMVVLFSIVMNLNSVNDLTIKFRPAAGGDSIACTCVPTTSGGDAYKKFTLTTEAAVTAGEYTLEVSTVVRSRDGVKLATPFTKAVTITAP